MKILLVGSTGFLGSRVSKKLVQDREINLLCPSHSELDLLQYYATEQYISTHKPDILIHCAANHAGVGSGISKELFFLESNLQINFNLVKSAYLSNVKKFITFGTSCCYNVPGVYMYDESYYWTGRSEITYGSAKRILLEHLQNQTVMKWVYLVPPNLYGPEDHFGDKNAHFVSATITKFDEASKVGNSVTVWGDGKQRRSFLYVDDLVEIVYEAINSDIYDHKIINIATENDSSIKEVVELIYRNYGNNYISVFWDTSKPTGTIKKQLKNEVFRRLNPNFKFTSIEDGIRQTLDWHFNNMR